MHEARGILGRVYLHALPQYQQYQNGTDMTYSSHLASRFLSGLALLAFAAAVSAQSANVNHERMLDAADATSDGANWMSWGRTYSEQRFSPLSQINEQNVSELGLAWYFDLDTYRGVEGTPVVVDGIMYTSSAWNLTYALDAVTGELPPGRRKCADSAYRHRSCGATAYS
jgi:glucose dehydrogenase